VNDNFVTVSNLTRQAGTKTLLSAINFDVRQGEFIFILGPNGAGKTTLLRCLNGLIPCEGEITIGGHPLKAMTRRTVASYFAHVPQGAHISFPLSVYDYVMSGRYPYLSRFMGVQKRDKAIVSEVLELADVKHLAGDNVAHLSGGELQRVLIAAALAQEPKGLLLDEPTAFLDPKMQEEIFKLLRSLTSDKKLSVLAVSHDINGALKYADRILGLKAGKMKFFGHPLSLITEELLPNPASGCRVALINS
jgi:iron complex transport system ATP-binding protein